MLEILFLFLLQFSTMMSFSYVVLGISCQLVPFLTTFPSLMFLAIMHGLLGGVVACLVPMIIMEELGLDQTAKALGFWKAIGGAAMACYHPLLGWYVQLD